MQLNDLTSWRKRGLAVLCGALLSLGHPPFDFPWGVFIAIPLLFALIRDLGFKSAFGIGWFAGLGYFAVALHWIVEPFLVDIARHGWMAPFALVFLAAGLALFWAAPFGLTRLISARGWLGGLVFAAVWTLAEYARSTVLTGFPWALLGYVWLETPIIQAASIFGSHVLGFATIALALVLRPHLRHLLLVAGVMVALWFGLAATIPHSVAKTDFTVRLLQPNAPQHEKWHRDHVRKFWLRQLEFTQAPGDVDLVVWPESAVPYLLDMRPDLNETIAAAAGDARVLIGATRAIETDNGRTGFNSAAMLGPRGEILHLYDKHHLVPFGEFLPFPAFFDMFGLQGLAQNAGTFSGGPGPALITPEGMPSFQPLICYEAIFAGEILRGAARPQWLVQLTNDAWFGNFSGPFQHLAQARIRAIEFGLPVARSANTGVSAMIGPHGRLVRSLGLNEAGFVDASLPDPLPPTLYARTGDLPWLVLLVVIALIGVVSVRLARPKTRNFS